MRILYGNVYLFLTQTWPKNTTSTSTITKVLPRKKSMQVASFPDLRNTFAPSLKEKLSFAPKKQASAVSTLTKEHKGPFRYAPTYLLAYKFWLVFFKGTRLKPIFERNWNHSRFLFHEIRFLSCQNLTHSKYSEMELLPLTFPI